MDPTLISALAARILIVALREGQSAAVEKLADLVRKRLADNPPASAALAEAEQEPDDPVRERRLQEELFDVVVADDVFAVNLARLVADAAQDGSPSGVAATANGRTQVYPAPLAESRQQESAGEPTADPAKGPVRGFLGLTVSATSPQTTAGTDFSIFVLVQNPFDVPITINQVQTHIPVDLIDVNLWRAKLAKLSAAPTDGPPDTSVSTMAQRIRQRQRLRRDHPGVATAIGTEITPEEATQLFKSQVAISRDLNVGAGGSASFAAVSFVMPKDASSDDLDALMRRVIDYQRGVIPIRLQPGDAVVRQFVLRTRSRLLFRPLTHLFQIQVNYSVDGVDHTGTIPYQLNIQAALGSIAAGSVTGAALGTLVRSLAQPAASLTSAHLLGILPALAVSVMASIAVVVAFARKSSAQPLVSIEDFWGGLVIGFTVGYFGFQTFFRLFPTSG